MTQRVIDQVNFQTTVHCGPGVYILKMDDGSRTQIEKLLRN